ncbi:hypothetical protein AGABI2DRAFT_195280 [Agaricus bisporus var. bisporus H97]|uniref:hypothetical protein n=1 Tax=Agaricus bisporus var. bisporus (strain H97 / ATCC MYA-4626 / FGSC 10389) TaxID=936046 RepID=UPI00029F52A1|nr:hypothetical protein AGABI2DRAFT_195280 [Agaricus bisporus var. bisporus H97]EKV43015.1 hypothetical protein AGABI2DRAFT_195280 [Agaricus bisporus var. bisporus H97]
MTRWKTYNEVRNPVWRYTRQRDSRGITSEANRSPSVKWKHKGREFRGLDDTQGRNPRAVGVAGAASKTVKGDVAGGKGARA